MKYHISHTIHDYDPVAWDSLAKRDFCMSHTWQRVLEEGWNEYQARYVLFEDTHGPAASLITTLNASFDRTGWREEAMKRATLFVSVPFSSMHCGIAIRDDLDIEMVLPHIEKALARICWQTQRAIYAVNSVDTARVTLFEQRGFIVAPQPTYARLDITSDTYDAYLAQLPSKDRAEIRRVRRRAAEAGVTIEHSPLTDESAEMWPLLCQVYARHGHTPDTMPFKPDLFSIMEREQPGSVHLFKGHVNGKLEGVLVTYLGEQALWWPFAGLNYVVSRPTQLYFALIDAMIRWSIEHGVKTIYGGLSNEREKRGHGFQNCDRWICYRAHPRPLHALFQVGLPLIKRVIGGPTPTPPQDPPLTIQRAIGEAARSS